MGKVYVFDHPLIQHKTAQKDGHQRQRIQGTGQRSGHADGL